MAGVFLDLVDESLLIDADFRKFTVLESRIPEELVWEVEHGFRKGVRDFYTCVDI